MKFNKLSAVASLVAALTLSVNAQAILPDAPSFVAQQVASCKASAGAAMVPEREACIKVVIERAVSSCQVAGAAMVPEREACIKVVFEDANK